MREEDQLRDQWLREMDSSPTDDAKLVAEWSREARQQKVDRTAELAELRTRLFGYRRRSMPTRRNRGNERHRATILKQFHYWIDQRVDRGHAMRAPADLVRVWAELTDYDLELAKRWWNAGVYPLGTGQVRELIWHGLNPGDLAVVIQGQTILEHLQSGTSVTWCINAIRWGRRASGRLA